MPGVKLQAKKQIRLIVLFYFVFLLQTFSAQAQHSDIVGSVHLETNTTANAGISIGGYRTTAPSGSEDSDDNTQNNILIWLVDAKRDTVYHGSDTELQVLDQENKRFKPRLIGIRSGETVRIKNSDPVYHNVFSLSKTKRFNVGRRSPDDHEDIRFDRTGTVDVFCDIHSDMHAVIQVFPNTTITWQKLESEGEFRFNDIAPGNYTLHFYALGNRQEQIQIEVSDSETIKIEPVRLGRH